VLLEHRLGFDKVGYRNLESGAERREQVAGLGTAHVQLVERLRRPAQFPRIVYVDGASGT
jgi:hypothetical protein